MILTRHLIRPSSLSLTCWPIQRQYPSTPFLRLRQTRFVFSSQQQPDGKLKKFMKKYGYVGVGVYLGLSIIDLSLTVALIQIKGADKVEQLEHWVVSKVKTSLGIQVPPTTTTTTTTTTTQQQHQPSWTSLFVLAYGIHKTLLLPVRLSITAAVTPMLARKLASLGWIKRQSLPKKA